LIKLLGGEERNMVTLQKINEVAVRWNKTKDPKDKELWYKLIEEWNGINNTKRWNVSSSSSDETDDRGHRTLY
jgi:hypothetical protein